MSWIVFAAALISATETGADDLTTRMQACAAVTSQSERVRCYDAVAATLSGQSTQAPDSQTPQSAEASPASGTASTNPPAVSADVVQSTPVGEPVSTPATASVSAAPAAPASESQVATQSPPASGYDNFGQEHWVSKRATPESMTARVSSVKKSAFGSLIIGLDNGQTWQQKGYERYSLKTGDEVVISHGMMNSFFLSSTRTNRKVRFFRVN